MVLGLAIAGLSLYACGGGGNKAPNPNDAAEEFSNPTGSLSSSNAKDVSNASLKAYNANGTSSSASVLSKKSSQLLNPKYFPVSVVSQSDIQNCTSTSGNSTTIDWSCLAPAIDNECTGDGTTKTTTNDSQDYYTVEYNDFGLNCSGDAEFDFSCNGSVSYSTSSENFGVYCSDITCEFNEFTTTFDGCVNLEGHYLIRVDGDSYVLESIEQDGSCNTLTLTIRDNNSTETIVCTVSDANQGCSTIDDINTVTSCEIQ